MKYISALIVVLTIMLLAACQTTTQSSVETITGSGQVTVAEREVSGFSGIQVNLGANLILTQGAGESLTIEADDNLMQYINTEVTNGRLRVFTPDNISLEPSQPIALRVGFETLNMIEINGSSNITGADIDLEALTIEFAGAGSTELSGTVDTQTVRIRGMAIIRNFDLISRSVILDISGNGTVEVHAEDALDITVAGTGNIRYSGDPTVTQNVAGSAEIARQS